MSPDLLNVAATAQRLGVSVRTVRNAIAAGRLRAVRIVGPEGDVTGYGIEPSELAGYEAPARGRPRAEPS